MPQTINHLYEFGIFQLDPAQRLLRCNGTPVSVTPKAFDLLVVLVEQSGRLLEKDELMGTVWPTVTVEEGNLSVTVSHLRKALGDDRGKHEYIETVSKRGYRFVAPVTERCDLPPDSYPGHTREIKPSSHEDLLRSGLYPRLINRFESMKPSHFRKLLIYAGIAIAILFMAGRFAVIKLRASRLAFDAVPIQSLAVLPFETMGVKSSDEYLGLGTADALITKLANTGKIVVRPTSAIEKYRNTSLSPEAAGKEQEVDAILDGRIQREAGRVRLTVQMVRVRDGAQLWADTFDEEFTNIFALEDEVSERVARSIQLHLTDKEVKRFTKRPTENAEAYEAYIKGRYFWNKRTGDGLEKGLQYFREAIRLDPGFAEAYEGVADSYAALGLYAVIPPQEAFPAARAAAKTALRMDDGLADARATLGLIDFYYDWNGTAAENEFRRAFDANPNYAMAHSWSSETLAAMGRFPEAMEEAKQALKDDPLSLIVSSNAGWTFCLAGHYAEAIQTLQKAIEIDPDFPRTHFRLGNVYEKKGLYDQAIAEFQQAVRLSGGDVYYEAALGHAYAVSGNLGEARQVLRALKERSTHQYVPAFAIALVYAGLKENDSAFEWLEKAYSDRSTSMAFLKVDPSLSGIRFDERFAKVAQHVSF